MFSKSEFELFFRARGKIVHLTFYSKIFLWIQRLFSHTCFIYHFKKTTTVKSSTVATVSELHCWMGKSPPHSWFYSDMVFFAGAYKFDDFIFTNFILELSLAFTHGNGGLLKPICCRT